MMCRRCEKSKPDTAFPASYQNHKGSVTVPRICKECRAFGPTKKETLTAEQSRAAVESEKLGVPIPEIARELGVSRQTLEYHLKSIKRAAPIALEDQSAIWMARPITRRSSRDAYDRAHNLTSGDRSMYRTTGSVHAMPTRCPKPGTARAGHVA